MEQGIRERRRIDHRESGLIENHYLGRCLRRRRTREKRNEKEDDANKNASHDGDPPDNRADDRTSESGPGICIK
jgi:hypothetical protein